MIEDIIVVIFMLAILCWCIVLCYRKLKSKKRITFTQMASLACLFIIYSSLLIVTFLSVYKKYRVITCELRDIQYYNITSDSTVEVRASEDHYEDITHIIIPPSIICEKDTYSVTRIGNKAFERCESLKHVSIPESVTSIGEYAFTHSNRLAEVVIPNSVSTIEKGAFGWCRSLESISLPNGLTSISESMFEYSRIKSIEIPNSVETIGPSAFSGCDSLVSVTMPNTITAIGDCAFFGCGELRDVNIPKGVTHIGYKVFARCNCAINIPEGVVSIGRGAYADHLFTTRIIVPLSVKELGYGAFANCGLISSGGLNLQTTIEYAGTKQQWAQIQREEYDNSTDVFNIQCTDGVIKAKISREEAGDCIVF